MARRKGPAQPTPHPFPSHHGHPPAHSSLSWGQPCPFRAAKVIPAPRAPLCKGGCRSHAGGAPRLPTPPSPGQQRQALPSAAKAIPISGGGRGMVVMASLPAFGSLAMRILLGNIEFLDAKKEQAHPSVLIKTTVRLLSALGKALPWEYQVGRLVIFPNSEAGKWKREFLHSSRPAKGLLSSIQQPLGDQGSFPIWGRRQD